MSGPLRLAARLAAALLVLAAAPVAQGYVRTTTGPGGPGLFWPPHGLTYQINVGAYAFAPGCTSAGAVADLTRASFPAWMNARRAGQASACTDFKFADGGDTTVTKLGNDGVNLVVFRKGLCSAITTDPLCAATATEAQTNTCIQTHNCWSHGDGSIIALTTATFKVSSGELVDTDMELHGWNGDVSAAATGWYFTCGGPGVGICANPPYGSGNCNWMDVGNTVTHEAGHMLGLDHVCTVQGNPDCHPEAVMAPNAMAGETSKRRLAPDDVDGVCSIYPPAQPGGGGCSTGGAGGFSLLALAAALWRRRLRR